MSATDVGPCPLCHGLDADVISVVPFDLIWDAYRNDLGLEVPDTVRASLEPATVTRCARCAACGLEFFTPAIPGNDAYYVWLADAMTIYAPERWEFGVVRSRLPSGITLIDLGCADGAFLRSISPVASRAVGVDHNAAAIAAVRSDGIEAYVGDFRSVAQRFPSTFDVVCAFQTLEHLADVGELLDPARRLLRDRGRLFVSVPNAGRVGARRVEALDCPPHHLTRWRVPQLEEMALRFDLDLIDVALEPPDLSHARLAVRRRLARWLPVSGSVPVRALARLLVPEWRVRSASWRSAAVRRGLYGHSMVAELMTR